MIVAPHMNAERKIVGALGVIGPTRLNYARVIPMVDYTAQVVGRLLGEAGTRTRESRSVMNGTNARQGKTTPSSRRRTRAWTRLSAIRATDAQMHARAVNVLAEQVQALEKERDELKDNTLRALAETDNVRKRANRQIEDARLYAVEKFARDLLNVSDNLARAVESVPPDSRR